MGELNSVGADFGGDDLIGTKGFADGYREEADGAHAGDENVLILDRTRHDGVDGIAEGVLEGGNFCGDASISGSRVVFRNHHVLGEATIDIHTQNLCVDTDVALATLALTTSATDDMGLGGDELSDLPILYTLAEFHDGSTELVADDSGREDSGGRPGVPGVNVEVRAANRGRL